jgi:hypothetical protein
MYRELTTVESLGRVVGKSLANRQRSDVLLLSGALNLRSLFRITRKDSGNVVDIVALFLYAEVSPMVGSPGRVVLAARNWTISIDNRIDAIGLVDLPEIRERAFCSVPWYS